MKRRAALLVAGSFLALTVPGGAQLPIPIGGPVLANLTLEQDQDEAAVAISQNDVFQVVWRDALLDNVLSAVVGRRFRTSTGAPLSGEVVINLEVVGDQRNPAVAMAADGRAVVVWEGPDTLIPMTSGIFGALLDANGVLVSNARDFPINTSIGGTQHRPAVAMLPGGRFLVVWEDAASKPKRILGRIYPADFPLSPPLNVFQVNVLTPAGDQEQPAVAVDPISGGWYVAWQGDLPVDPVGLGGPASVPSILVRRLSGSGSGPAEIPLNTSLSPDGRRHASVAANAQGAAVVVWEAPDGVLGGIFARPLLNGVPTTAQEVRVNIESELDEREPSVAIDSSGRFVATWVRAVGAVTLDSNSDPLLGSPIVIKGRRGGGGGAFSFGGGPQPDDEFEVSAGGGNFADPWVASESNGNFLVAWQGTDTPDPDGDGVYFRRFAIPIFADDFETGDPDRWDLISSP